MTMSTEIHETLLETYFFERIDQGAPPEKTPLFTGLLKERPLVDVLKERFSVTSDEAAAAIETARREVEL